MNKYRSIQGLRAIAARVVVMGHYVDSFASLQNLARVRSPG